jgi:hypothetical protein
MAQQDILYMGEDQEVEFTLTKSDNTPLNLATEVQGLLVVFYRALDNKPIPDGRYSMNPATGYNSTDFEIVDAAGGKFKIKLQAEVTRGIAYETTLLCELKLKFSDPDFSNNDFEVIERQIVIAQAKKALTSNESTY